MEIRVKQITPKTILALAVILLAVGSVGYHLIEGWSLFDSFYMTVITISTVGYREMGDMSEPGRLWTITLIIVGVSMAAFIVARFTEQLADVIRYRRRKMLRRIEKLKDHYIICGYGRIGRVIAEELKRSGSRFVIIERNTEQLEDLDAETMLYLNANAVDEDVLLQANIRDARGLVSVIDSDAENVFLTLVARELNPDLFIVARSVDPAATLRIRKAGANKVLNPYNLSGYRMAQMLINPKVNEFVDMLREDSHLGMSIEEVLISLDSSMADRSIAEINFRKNYSILITGIIRRSGELLFNPAPDTLIEAGDSLIAIGKKQDIGELKHAAAKSVN